MKLSHIIIVSMIVLWVGWKAFYHPKFPDEASGSLTLFSQSRLTETPCAGREYCVFVYMAPWCPACKAAIPLVSDLRNFWRDNDRPGMMVIIGNGKPDALEAMARLMGSPVFLDKQDKFLHAAGVRHFPYFIVVDKEKNILARGQAAQRWVEQEINRHRK